VCKKGRPREALVATTTTLSSYFGSSHFGVGGSWPMISMDIFSMWNRCCLPVPTFEVPASEMVSPREGLHVTSLLRWSLQEELGLLALRLNGTFLSPLELLVVACTSRGWCQTVEECSASLVFAGPYTQDLLIESQLMWERLPFNVDFDPRNFRLALHVGAESVNQVPKRVVEAVMQIRYSPWLPRHTSLMFEMKRGSPSDSLTAVSCRTGQ